MRRVDAGAVVPEDKRDDDGDGEDGGGFDPEHEAGGDLDVAVSDGGGDGDAEESEERCGCGAVEEEGEEDVGVVDETSGYGCSRGDVGEQERPAGDASGDRWEGGGGVGVEGAGAGGVPGEAAEAERDEEDGDGGEEIGEPCSVAGEGEDQRHGHGGRGCGGDGGDGLGEGFDWREDVGAQAGGDGRFGGWASVCSMAISLQLSEVRVSDADERSRWIG